MILPGGRRENCAEIANCHGEQDDVGGRLHAGPAEDDDDDGVGDDGYAGKDGHDDAKEGVDKVERSVELGGVHQVAGGHVRLQAGDPAHFFLRM